jgi:translation elongation factor EF-Tu-like GTPase
MEPAPDIEAEITYLPTAAGGRQKGVLSGYRSQFYYDGHDWDAEQTFVDCEWVEPGRTVTTHLRFLSPQSHDGKLVVGTVFLIREGSKTVGYGAVTRMLNLHAHAEEVRSREKRQPSMEAP